ncbi:unnamed protein product, partial [Mesorhabditis spiculigera]
MPPHNTEPPSYYKQLAGLYLSELKAYKTQVRNCALACPGNPHVTEMVDFLRGYSDFMMAIREQLLNSSLLPSTSAATPSATIPDPISDDTDLALYDFDLDPDTMLVLQQDLEATLGCQFTESNLDPEPENDPPVNAPGPATTPRTPPSPGRRGFRMRPNGDFGSPVDIVSISADFENLSIENVAPADPGPKNGSEILYNPSATILKSSENQQEAIPVNFRIRRLTRRIGIH